MITGAAIEIERAERNGGLDAPSLRGDGRCRKDFTGGYCLIVLLESVSAPGVDFERDLPVAPAAAAVFEHEADAIFDRRRLHGVALPNGVPAGASGKDLAAGLREIGGKAEIAAAQSDPQVSPKSVRNTVGGGAKALLGNGRSERIVERAVD